jgi:hypothetical protein
VRGSALQVATSTDGGTEWHVRYGAAVLGAVAALAKISSGKCCIKYSAIAGALHLSSWNTTTYLCQ